MEETFVLDREMGCTRDEFMRWLGGATRQARSRVEGEEIALAVGEGEVRIWLRQEPPRRIALVEIPVLRVRFRFRGLDRLAREAFLDHFDTYTRRGGG